MKPFAHLILGVGLLASPVMASPWDLDELFELEGERGMVTDTAYAPDGTKVLSCDVKGSVYAWNPATGLELWHLEEMNGNFSRITVSNDGRMAAVVGLHFAGVIDVGAGTWIKKFTLPNAGSGSAVALSESNLLLAVGESGSHIWLIDLPSGTMIDYATHDWGIMDLRFMDHDQFLLVGDATTVRVWDVEARTDRRIVDTEAGDIPGMFFLSHMSFSDDGKFVLVSSGNDAILFNLEAKTMVQTFTGHDKEVVALRVTHDLVNVITSSRDHTTRVWDIETGETVGTSMASDLSLTAAIGVSPANDQFIMSAAIVDIFGGTIRAKLGIWAIHPKQ